MRQINSVVGNLFANFLVSLMLFSLAMAVCFHPVSGPQGGCTHDIPTPFDTIQLTGFQASRCLGSLFYLCSF